MAIEQGIWKLANNTIERPQRLRPKGMADENLLEEQIMQDISILNRDWLLIGRQVRTGFDKLIDLLALDANGNVIIIELKRDKTPRDVVAQAIDYASWVVTLANYQINDIYRTFAERYSRPYAELKDAFMAKFGIALDDSIALNDSHQMVVVATRLDASSERIINYLNAYGGDRLSINAMFFSAFEYGGNQYLSRAWLMDPDEAINTVARTRADNAWNNEFYASFGPSRPWELARHHGFIAGGGANWYSKTLNLLSEGDRVWVNIPKTGYVGVAKVTGERCRADEFMVDTEHGSQSLKAVTTPEEYPHLHRPSDPDDEETLEYVVPVRWIKSLPADQAFREVGLFGNQNTVCKPTAPKWDHTVARLKQAWGVE